MIFQNGQATPHSGTAVISPRDGEHWQGVFKRWGNQTHSFCCRSILTQEHTVCRPKCRQLCKKCVQMQPSTIALKCTSVDVFPHHGLTAVLGPADIETPAECHYWWNKASELKVMLSEESCIWWMRIFQNIHSHTHTHTHTHQNKKYNNKSGRVITLPHTDAACLNK